MARLKDKALSAFSYIDLFAGAGGFTLGLEAAGGDPQSHAVEADPDCGETFRANFPEASLVPSDIREVRYKGIEADVVVAGPPCQGFSLLNRGRRGDPRNLLFEEVVRCVKAVRPHVVVVENVPRFLDSSEGQALVAALENRGFRVRSGLVNAADYGVPQARTRALVVGAKLGGAVPWPVRTHAASASALPPHRTVADAFTLLSTEPDGRNWHVDVLRTDRIERLRAVREGGNRRDLSPDLLFDCWKDTDGFNDVMGRLVWHKPATTVRTEFFRPEKGRFLHPVADRPITPREAARLQSFPDSFEFPATHGLYSVGRQIGNAIPPRLAAAIGKAVAQSLSAPRRNQRRRRPHVAIA